jgi:hypothetical protein
VGRLSAIRHGHLSVASRRGLARNWELNQLARRLEEFAKG